MHPNPRYLALRTFLEHPEVFEQASDRLAFHDSRSPGEFAGETEDVPPHLTEEAKAHFEEQAKAFFNTRATRGITAAFGGIRTRTASTLLSSTARSR